MDDFFVVDVGQSLNHFKNYLIVFGLVFDLAFVFGSVFIVFEVSFFDEVLETGLAQLHLDVDCDFFEFSWIVLSEN